MPCPREAGACRVVQHARLPRRPRRGSQRRSRHRSGRALPAGGSAPPRRRVAGVALRRGVRHGVGGASSGQWRDDDLRLRAHPRLRCRSSPTAGAVARPDSWVCRGAPGDRRLATADRGQSHLSLRPEERQRHAGAILAALADQPGALVVAGDLNELNDGAAHRAFAQGLRVVSGSVPTYPSRAPRKALDVIFATPHLKVVAGPPVVLDDAVLAAASDHRPVWVDLTPGSV